MLIDVSEGEKIFVLSADVFENYIEKINFKTERGKITAEIDFNIIKVMIDVIHSYIISIPNERIFFSTFSSGTESVTIQSAIDKSEIFANALL